MKEHTQSAIILAGTHSGCGKTTVSLGIMAALAGRGLHVQPFKCGPDFIDPTLHRLITGRVSRNLDMRMCGSDYVRSLFERHTSEKGISVIEGVMGLFDGGNGSAARLASLLRIPVILIVDVRAAAESAAAVIKGFETLDPDVQVAGVILNRVAGDRHFQMIADAAKKYCRAEIIGGLPYDDTIVLPSRHLGLLMGTEVHLNRKRLVEMMEKHLDLDRLLKLSRLTKPANPECKTLQSVSENRVRLGVAWDDAFCFYYQDNLEMLEQAGAEIVLFSPLNDAELPGNLDGLYLGGGYPELHAPALTANTSMRRQILEFSRSGKPVYAECGGFMYLTRAIVDVQGGKYPMVGVYPVSARMRKHLCRLGYRQVEMQTDTLLGNRGSHCYGHEFHYSEIKPPPAHVARGYIPDTGPSEGYLLDNTLAGYVHLHWGRTPETARNFVQMMQKGSE